MDSQGCWKYTGKTPSMMYTHRPGFELSYSIVKLCVPLDRFLNHSMPWFPHLSNWENNSSTLED